MPKVNPEKLEKNRMKKLVGAHLLFVALLFALITPVYASVTMQAIIDEDVCVTFDFKNLDSMIYWTIYNRSLITESTIPDIIMKNLRQQNLTHVSYYTPAPARALNYTSESLSLRVTFYLYGSDILNFTVDTESMRRTYYVRTDWRKFQFNVTDGISLDFDKYFDKPVDEWRRINYTLDGGVHPAYYHNFTGSTLLDPLCYFILPAEATNVQAVKDTIMFELPPSFEDSMLNSPFLILGAIIVVIVASSLYRKVRK